MAVFSFQSDDRIKEVDERFITLGRSWADLSDTERDAARRRIQHQRIPTDSRVWATLGWKNDTPFTPQGRIQFSESGNMHSVSVTRQQVEVIRDFNPLTDSPHFVRERYINLNELQLRWPDQPVHLDALPELRLTLFVEPDEGAVVFLQHSDPDDHHDPKAEIDYILPQKAPQGRDRLTYYIPVIPPSFTEDENRPGHLIPLDQPRKSSYILKILTFKRRDLPEKSLLDDCLLTLGKRDRLISGLDLQCGVQRYGFLKFDPLAGVFRRTGPGLIDYSAKTLLLIHGTFSSVEHSFAGLYQPAYSTDPALLSELLTSGRFGQIIGFNHPTILHDAFQNAQVMYQLLEGQRFEQSVSIIGSSRGALVSRWLASDPDNECFEVDKVLTFCGANGVEYFTAGEKIVRLMSIFHKLGGPAGKILTLFAQFSGEFFLNLPGCRQMNPESHRLQRIMESRLRSADTRYQAVAADWHHSLQSVWQKKAPAIVLDTAIKLILGREHDWVVSLQSQKRSPADQSLPPIELEAMHTKVLQKDHARPDPHGVIRGFLISSDIG